MISVVCALEPNWRKEWSFRLFHSVIAPYDCVCFARFSAVLIFVVVIGHMICRATDPIHQLVANDSGHARGVVAVTSHAGFRCFVFWLLCCYYCRMSGGNLTWTTELPFFVLLSLSLLSWFFPFFAFFSSFAPFLSLFLSSVHLQLTLPVLFNCVRYSCLHVCNLMESSRQKFTKIKSWRLPGMDKIVFHFCYTEFFWCASCLRKTSPQTHFSKNCFYKAQTDHSSVKHVAESGF